MSTRTPAEVFPPGDFIREELEERGWTQLDLAKIMGRPASVLNAIITGKKGITPETARELAGAFGTSAEFWLNLENAYKLSKVEVEDAAIRARAQLFELAPIKELERRGTLGIPLVAGRIDSLEQLLDDLEPCGQVGNVAAPWLYDRQEGVVFDRERARQLIEAYFEKRLDEEAAS